MTRTEVVMAVHKTRPQLPAATCAVAGLATLELYKLAAGLPVTANRCFYLDLATNYLCCYEPSPPQRARAEP